jgi:hypothetical protein
LEQQPEVRVQADKARLWKQVDQLLQRRPGWRFQAVPTPGAPPVWGFETEGEPDLLVTVDRGSIFVYKMGSDDEVELASTGELVVWLNAQKPGSLQPQRGKLKRASVFRWD